MKILLRVGVIMVLALSGSTSVEAQNAVGTSCNERSAAQGVPRKSLAETVCERQPQTLLIVHGHEEKFFVPVTTQYLTTVAARKDGFRHMGVTERVKGFNPRRPVPHVAKIKLDSRAKMGQTFTLVVDGRSTIDGTEYKALVVFVACSSALAAPLNVDILHESEDAAAKQKQQRAKQAKERRQKESIGKAHQRGKEEGHKEGWKIGWTEATREMLFQRAEELLLEPGPYAPAETGLREGRSESLRYQFKQGDWFGSFFLFVLNVQSERPFALASPTIETAEGSQLSTTVVYPAATPEPTIPVTKQWKSIAIAVQIPLNRSTDGLQLKLGANGTPSMEIVAQIPRYRLMPETQEEEDRRIWGSQMILGPRVFGGAFWLTNGRSLVDGRELKAASFYGFGARFTKGFTHSFAFEAEIGGGTTGSASFDMDGQELKRKAKFGRIQGGGVVRFGHKINPLFRLGIGLQGTSYDSETNGTKPDDSVEFNALFAFGAGVVYRLNEGSMAGVAVSVTVPTGADELRTFEIGGFIGYGWNP